MRRAILKLGAGWVLCAAAWTACGGETIVARKDLGFQISVPDGFTVVDVTILFMADVVRAEKIDSGNNWAVAGVKVTDLKEGDSLRSFFTIPYCRDWLKMVTLTAIDIVKMDGRSALKLTTTRAGWQAMTYYTVANARGYAIEFWTPKSSWDKYAKEIDAIVASFKIIDSK